MLAASGGDGAVRVSEPCYLCLYLCRYVYISLCPSSIYIYLCTSITAISFRHLYLCTYRCYLLSICTSIYASTRLCLALSLPLPTSIYLCFYLPSLSLSLYLAGRARWRAVSSSSVPAAPLYHSRWFLFVGLGFPHRFRQVVVHARRRLHQGSPRAFSVHRF